MPIEKLMPWIILAAILGIELPGYIGGQAKDEAVAASRAATAWRKENEAKLERVEFLELELVALRAQNTQLMNMLGYMECDHAPE